MKKRIQEATTVLVGRALWRASRAADLASFDFGDRRTVADRRGGTKTVGEYAVHIQCAWRFVRGDEVVVGSRDLYYPVEYQDEGKEIPDDFDWDRNPNRRDKLLSLLFEGGNRDFVVQRVEVGDGGSLKILLTDNLSLEVYPVDSLNHEHWRLFRPGTEAPHFVVTGRGVET